MSNGSNSPVKVGLAYTDYLGRGLRVPAGVVDGPVGSEIVVFDRDYVSTRHFVKSRDGDTVVIGPARLWPDDESTNKQTGGES